MMKSLINKILISLLVLLFIGCSNAKQECVPVVEVKQVLVPVYPEIPKVDCNFEGEGFEPLTKVLECLSLHKRILEQLTKDREEQLFKNKKF